MPVWNLPYSREEQIKVCVALRNHNFVSSVEKDEVKKIESNVKYSNLTELEKSYLEKLIGQYGSNLEI